MLPCPAARLDAILLHWLLLPQLASAALPALPAPLLAEMALAAAGQAAGAARDAEGELPVSSVLEGEGERGGMGCLCGTSAGECG
jgi:hypothetical protein